MAANCYRSEEKHSQSKLHPHIQTLTFTSRRNSPHQLSNKWNKDGCVFLGDLIKTCPGHQTFALRNQRRKIIYFSMLIFLMALNIGFIICKIYWLYLLHSYPIPSLIYLDVAERTPQDTQIGSFLFIHIRNVLLEGLKAFFQMCSSVTERKSLIIPFLFVLCKASESFNRCLGKVIWWWK